ncbi:hypothetical protein Pst134EA_026641 [Puccinia striiformis f. sp. tritici]|uniref:hypothetical protein n=1 Tax=Puccinia striiformis f. sp. tritici TaxID=168172 RepID=UPI0020079DEE|nr:hypothetical protein Pst134EA_026641 [Puccinia striiformis f. sp. tritici]KAH9449930.1 hypothetical protein Pst134EA_026641 [Puccinia striiformis f. sp. tritici]
MTSTRAPNHPVNISGCFETLDASVPDSVRANQYGNVATPSCVPCAGLLGDKAEDIELTLITNTTLNNILQPSSIYFLAGRLLAPNDGSTPVLTYQQTSLVRVTAAGPTAPDFANKATVVGLGLVVKRQEIVSNADDGVQNLHVTVQHSDWDAITHGLYVVGREIEVTGNLVDFDMENYTAVVSVNSVAVTTGHQIGRLTSNLTASPSGSKTGRKFKTFPTNKPQAASSQPFVDPKKDAFTDHSSDVEMSTHDATRPDGKGKRKASPPDHGGLSDSYDSDTPILSQSACSSGKIRPRTNILQDAAKCLKTM